MLSALQPPLTLPSFSLCMSVCAYVRACRCERDTKISEKGDLVDPHLSLTVPVWVCVCVCMQGPSIPPAPLVEY